MRAILIDPVEKQIRVVETSGKLQGENGLPGIYDLLEVDCIDVVQLPIIEECMYVDDEGLLKPNHFFDMFGFSQPIGGKALILRTDAEGESQGSDISAHGLRKLVKWEGGPHDRSDLATFTFVEMQT